MKSVNKDEGVPMMIDEAVVTNVRLLLQPARYRYTQPPIVLQKLCEALLFEFGDIRSVDMRLGETTIASAEDINRSDGVRTVVHITASGPVVERPPAARGTFEACLAKCLDHNAALSAPGAADDSFPLDARGLLREYLSGLRQCLLLKGQPCNAGFQVRYPDRLQYVHVEGSLSQAGRQEATDPLTCITQILNEACAGAGLEARFTRPSNLVDLKEQLLAKEPRDPVGTNPYVATLTERWNEEGLLGRFEEFLKELLCSVPQWKGSGFVYRVMDCRGPTYYPDLGSVEIRGTLHNRWSYALMIAIERRFGLGGLQLAMDSKLYEEKCWMIVVPSFYDNVVQGFAYAYGNYYIDGDRAFVFGEGHMEESAVAAYLRESLPILMKEMWLRADGFASLIHDVQELEFLSAIGDAIRRTASEREFLEHIVTGFSKHFEVLGEPVKVRLRNGWIIDAPRGGETNARLSASRAWALHDAVDELRRRTRERGTHASVAALATRNLSHNLGSHVLRWLEMEAREGGQSLRSTMPEESSHYQQAGILYGFLAERMELATACAVYLPGWMARITADTLRELPGDVLRTIGRAEGVQHVRIELQPANVGQKQVALPGGRLGLQAFYSIVENVVRDATKYGQLRPAMTCIVRDTGEGYSLSTFDASSKLSSKETGKGSWVQPLATNLAGLTESFNRLVVFVLDESGDGVAGSNIGRDSNSEEAITRLLGSREGIHVRVWIIDGSRSCADASCKSVRKAIEEGDVRRLLRSFLNVTIEVCDIPEEELEEFHPSIRTFLKNAYLRVRIFDDRVTADVTQIQQSLSDIASRGLCDDAGSLLPSDWGIKERYIFATFLRGERIADHLIPSDEQRDAKRLPMLTPGLTSTGQLTWAFYLFKPRDVLVVSDCPNAPRLDHNDGLSVDCCEWRSLPEFARSGFIRHQFVLLLSGDGDVEMVERLLDHLPCRLVATADLHSRLSERAKDLCASVEELDLEQMSLGGLYRCWLDYLCGRRGRFGDLTILDVQPGRVRSHLVPATQPTQTLRPASAIFDRHALVLRSSEEASTQYGRLLDDSATYYEPYLGGWSAERWIGRAEAPDLLLRIAEAAHLKILIVDERIDHLVANSSAGIMGISLSMRELWRRKGVTVHGSKYEGSDVPDETPILGWLRSNDESPAIGGYDFVLIHHGILDKIHDQHYQRKNLSKEQSISVIVRNIQAIGSCRVVVHSGRGGGAVSLPNGVKFLHLSAVDAWFSGNASKLDVVDELMNLRRTDL